MTLRYGSVCSGIEAASVAWEPLGWTPAWFCEIEPFPSTVLAHRYPGVPNHGDFTQLLDPAHPVHREPPIDVLVGGTPCQDFSIAGLRAGIEGQRGSLTLDFCRLVDVLRPRWVVWENVPGVLSSDGGRAFGSLLGALAELGFGFAWRVLDAQHFGLAQRRKRVFVVGHSGGSPSGPGAVLLEPEGVRGDPPTRRGARQVAPTLPARRTAGGGLGTDFDCDGGLIVQPPEESFSFQPRIARNGRDQPEPISPTLNGADAGATSDMRPCVVQVVPTLAVQLNGDRANPGVSVSDDLAFCLPAHPMSDRGQAVLAFDFKQSGSDATEEMSPTLRATPHARSWANGGGHVAILEPTSPSPRTEDLEMRHLQSFQSRGSNVSTSDVAGTLGSNCDRASGGAPMVAVILKNRRPKAAFATNVEHGLHAAGNLEPVALKASHYTRGKDGARSEVTPPLSADADKGDQDTLVLAPEAEPRAMIVRRLTPRECERLQGFPDDWTQVPYRGGLAADANRYRALGNSMAVPVMRWIGERIQRVDAEISRNAASLTPPGGAAPESPQGDRSP